MNEIDTEKIKETVLAMGIDFVGVADLEPFMGTKVIPSNLLDGFTRAISIAKRLPATIFEKITDRPTPEYFSVYQSVNQLLDHIAIKIALLLEDNGFRSLPIPASQLLDRENWYGAISHKAVARMAGIGWQGKSLLIITPSHGPRIRLATILTNSPLEPDKPIENRCGKCTECRDACPSGAIKGVGTEDRYKNRDEALYFSRCLDKVTGEFAKLPEIGAPICGICIKVCPFGRSKS